MLLVALLVGPIRCPLPARDYLDFRQQRHDVWAANLRNAISRPPTDFHHVAGRDRRLRTVWETKGSVIDTGFHQEQTRIGPGGATGLLVRRRGMPEMDPS